MCITEIEKKILEQMNTYNKYAGNVISNVTYNIIRTHNNIASLITDFNLI